MRIKHSKYKNTGLIFELLVKQITADTLNRVESPAIGVLKKYFTGKTALVREFKLYEFILKNKSTSQTKAESIISTIIEVSKSIDQVALKNQKYSLIRELKEKYNLEEFFSTKVQDYTALAALYCLVEAHRVSDIVDPTFIVENKVTLLEHLTQTKQDSKEVRDNLIEEYSKYDKDLKILTFRILLEKFNNKYENLSTEQKDILREFITSTDSTPRLRNVINTQIGQIRNTITSLSEKVTDDIIKIKLQEVTKNIVEVSKTEKIKDDHLVSLLQYYELVKELKEL